MKINRLLIGSVLAAGTAATIAVTPIAAAAPAGPNCVYSAPGNSLCASGGNAQIVATPNVQAVSPYDQWIYPYGPYGQAVLRDNHHHHDHPHGDIH